MTATFVLAFAQGAASVIETANVLVDGFGVIAMVAMAPVFSIMLLGTLFRHTKTEKSVAEEKHAVPSELFEEDNMQHHLIMAVVNRGFAENVVELARKSGAKGATILHGRGTEEHHKVLLPIINIELYPEKEIILLVTETNLSEQIADNLLIDPQLKLKGEISVYISYTEAMIKVS